MPPLAGMADWEVTVALSNALGYPMHYDHPSRDHGRDRAPDADLPRRELRRRSTSSAASSGRATSRRRRARRSCTSTSSCAARAASSSPSTCRPTSGPRASIRCILTTGRILSQYNVGAQTRRTDNVVWHDEDRLEIHPHDAEQRGIKRRRLGRHHAAAPARRCCARRSPSACSRAWSTPPSIFPDSGANVITTDNSDWATNCPEYKVTAVQVSRVTQPSEWQKNYERFSQKQVALLKERKRTNA